MFLLGSFTSGLFNGASQAASLYNMYQGIAAGAATEDAMKQDQPTPKVTSEPDATTPDTGADTPGGGGAGGAGGGGGTGADERFNPEPSKRTVVKPTTGEDTRRSPADPNYKPTTEVTPPGALPRPATTDPYRVPAATGVPETTPPPTTPPTSGVPSAEDQSAQTGLPLPSSPAPRVGALPLSGAPFNAAGVSGPPGTPSGPAPNPQAGRNSFTDGLGQLWQKVTGPSAGFTQPPAAPYTPPPPSNTVQPGGYFGGGAGDVGGGVRRPVVIPPPQPPASVGAPPGGAPGVGGGVPVAQDQQPGWAGRALVAQAQGAAPSAPAGPTGQFAGPGAPPAQDTGTSAGDVIRGALGIGSAQAKEPGITTGETAPATGVSDRTAIPTSYPTAGVQPAKPSPTAPPTQAPAPVATEAKVAPGQTTPSKSSEPVTPAYAPHVDPSALEHFKQTNPQLAQWMVDSAAKSGGTVTAEQLAQTKLRESGDKMGYPIGDGGASKGIMQMGDTEARTVDPQGRLDRHDPRQAIELSAQYYRWLAEGDRTRGGFGSNSVLTNYAYMRGVGAANDVMAAERMHPGSGMDWIKRANPQAAGFLDKMYGGDGSGNNKVGLHFPPTGQGNGQYSMSAMVTAAHTGGPDALMKYIFTSGPVTGTTDKWRSAQAQVISHMISTGNYASIGAVTDWFSQQAHQGALSHMAAGYEALQSGDMQTASQQLAMAHAFFPDGTFAKFGVSGDGKTLMGQQFDEGTMQPIGQPMRITPDTLAAHMMHLNHPGNFIDALQKFQLTNSELSLNKAKETYFSGRNETSLEKTQLSLADRQRHDDAVEAGKDADRRSREGIAAQRQEGAADRTARSHDIKDNEADKYYSDPDNKPANPDGSKMSDDRFATQGQIEHELRRQPQASGELMSTPLARNAAQAIVQGRLSPKQQLDQNNKPTGYTDWVDKDGAARATTDDKTANYFMHLAGANPKRAPGQQGALNITSPVGAGGGSPTAAMQGMGMNMTGQPSQALQTATA
jgi:hypothetical protein